MSAFSNTLYASNNLAPVFVTGNANKLKEVKAILSEGGNPIDIDSQSLDSKYLLKFTTIEQLNELSAVPEIQGSTQEVARDKCRRAAELVSSHLASPALLLVFVRFIIPLKKSDRDGVYNRRHRALLCCA